MHNQFSRADSRQFAQSGEARFHAGATRNDYGFVRADEQRIYEDLVDFASTRYEREFERGRQCTTDESDVSDLAS